MNKTEGYLQAATQRSIRLNVIDLKPSYQPVWGGKKKRFLLTFWEEGPDGKEGAVCTAHSSGVYPPPTLRAMPPSAGDCCCHVQNCVVEYSDAVVLPWKVIPLASHLWM